MQNYHCPRTVGEVRERGLEPLPELTTFRRIAKHIRNQFRELLRVPYFPPARQIERRICDDPIEPRAESLPRIEPVERLISPQESVLHGILGVLMRHDDRARHYVGPPLVQTHEPGETPLVPLPGQTYELSLLIRNT